MADKRTPPVGQRYYAKGDQVFHHPLRSATGIRMGFLVCTLGSGVELEGAQEIADALNAADLAKLGGERAARSDARLREELLVSRGQFAFYAVQHRNKGTPEADAKAIVNEQHVARIDAVLNEEPK